MAGCTVQKPAPWAPGFSRWIECGEEAVGAIVWGENAAVPKGVLRWRCESCMRIERIFPHWQKTELTLAEAMAWPPATQ